MVRIEGVGANAFPDAFAFSEFGDVAILAVEATHRIGGSYDTAPDRGRRPLGNGFPAECRGAPSRIGGVYIVD